MLSSKNTNLIDDYINTKKLQKIYNQYHQYSSRDIELIYLWEAVTLSLWLRKIQFHLNSKTQTFYEK